MESDNKRFDEIYQLLEIDDSKNWALYSLKELFPQKKKSYIFILCIVCGILFGFLAAHSLNTVSIVQKVCDTILTIQVAILGCSFTTYTILLGIFSDHYVERLLHVDLKRKANSLSNSIRYFGSSLFIFFIGVIISGLIKLLLFCIPEDWSLFSSLFLNQILATIFLSLYYSCSFRIILEIKSTIYNTIFLVQTNIAYTMIELYKEDNNTDK